MKDVAVVAYCRTGIARATRGALNQTHGIPMTAHVLRHAVKRAGIDPAEVEDVVVGCGISLVQFNLNMNGFFYAPLQQRMPAVWWTMNQTADFVAKKYGISREAQDAYVVQSQARVAAAAAAGKFAEEIVPFTTTMKAPIRRRGRVTSKRPPSIATRARALTRRSPNSPRSSPCTPAARQRLATRPSCPTVPRPS